MSKKYSARNSRAGNGCAKFMGTWHFLALSAGENLHAHKIPRFRSGYFGHFFWGGGGCESYFDGHSDFSEIGDLQGVSLCLCAFFPAPEERGRAGKAAVPPFPNDNVPLPAPLRDSGA